MPSPDLNAILPLDKPLGITSMQAVARVRRLAGGARTGHAGTLDPLATGVLVLALGKCTRQIESLMATEKRYLTEIDLTAFTATDDVEGERTEVPLGSPGAAAAAPSRAELERTLAERFTGTVMQRPPAFSAMKVGGRRRLTIPPHMGYGDRGAGGVIKGGETLVFVVDLLNVN